MPAFNQLRIRRSTLLSLTRLAYQGSST